MTGKQNASVWGASNEYWDNLLNDPEFASEIESVKKQTVISGGKSDVGTRTGELDHIGADCSITHGKSVDNSLAENSVADNTVEERLLAYQTPITDEILRQSID